MRQQHGALALSLGQETGLRVRYTVREFWSDFDSLKIFIAEIIRREDLELDVLSSNGY